MACRFLESQYNELWLVRGDKSNASTEVFGSSHCLFIECSSPDGKRKITTVCHHPEENGQFRSIYPFKFNVSSSRCAVVTSITINNKICYTQSKACGYWTKTGWRCTECAENARGLPSTGCLVQRYVRKMETTNSDTFKIGNNILWTEHTFALADQLRELDRAKAFLDRSETEMCKLNTVNAPFSGIPIWITRFSCYSKDIRYNCTLTLNIDEPFDRWNSNVHPIGFRNAHFCCCIRLVSVLLCTNKAASTKYILTPC